MILLIDGVNYIEGTFDELANSTDPKVQAFLNSLGNGKTNSQKIQLGIFVIIGTLVFLAADLFYWK